MAGRWFPVSERSYHEDKPQSHPGLSVFVDTESLSTSEICSLLILNPCQQAVITESCRAPCLLAVGTQRWNEEVRMCCWRVARLVLWCSSSRRTSGGVEESHRQAWSRQSDFDTSSGGGWWRQVHVVERCVCVCAQICSARETADSIFLENSQHLTHTVLIQQGCGLASCSCVSQTAQAEEANDALTPPSWTLSYTWSSIGTWFTHMMMTSRTDLIATLS